MMVKWDADFSVSFTLSEGAFEATADTKARMINAMVPVNRFMFIIFNLVGITVFIA
jgi:hypothetical protein